MFVFIFFLTKHFYTRTTFQSLAPVHLTKKNDLFCMQSVCTICNVLLYNKYSLFYILLAWV